MTINVLVSLVILFLLIKFARVDIKSFCEQIKNTNLFWFIVTVITCVIQIFTNTYRWHILTGLLGYKMNFSKALKLYFEGSFANNFLPINVGGDAIRAYELGKAQKDWLRAASTVFVERLIGFIIMFSSLPIGLITLSLDSDTMGLFSPSLLYSLWGIFILMIIGLLSYQLWSRIPFGFVQRIKYAVEEYTKCHKSMTKVFIWTFATHLLLLLSNISAAKSLGADTTLIPVWYWFIITPASTLAGFIIPSAKGIGAREAAYVYFLGLLAINSEKSLAIAFVSFIAAVASTLPGITIMFDKIKLFKFKTTTQQ